MIFGNAGAPGGHGPQGHGDGDDEIFASFDSGILRRFYGFVRPYRSPLVWALLSAILYVASQVAIPLTIRSAVDHAVARGDGIPVEWIVLGLGLLAATSSLFNFLQEWTAARLAQKVIFDLRRAMFAHLQDVSLSFLDQTHVGRIMSRLQGDVNALQEFLETSVSAVGDLALLIGIFAVLLWMDFQLGLLSLSVVPVLVAARALWLPWAKTTFRRARDASSIVNGVLAENIGGVRTIQESRREAVNFTHYETKAREYFDAQIASSRAAAIMVPTVDFLTGLAQAIVVVAGGLAVLGGRLDVGVMIAFIFYVQRFFDPIRTLSQQYTVMQRAMAAGYRIFEVLDVPVTVANKPDAIPLETSSPSIEFSHVTFGYKPGRPILHDLSFAIEPGQVAALVGPTGSGKTSIAALIHRFYDVWQGEIRLGGQDVRDLTQRSLGGAIAMVLQEPFLFTGTVAENIRFSSDHANRDTIVEAAKAVHAHDFIMALPQGYDTELGQRGQNLSIGQRQLLSFARALVADPKILILDEATASIDSDTEQKIQAALKVLLKGRTSIVIAHRLSTVRDADKILVLRNGRLLEQGNHTQLVAAGGLYADLCRRSQSSFDDERTLAVS